MMYNESKTSTQQRRGQTKTDQLNGLKDIEQFLVTKCNLSRKPWKVKNGYIESSTTLMQPFQELLASQPSLEETLISLLRIGVQEDTTVTESLLSSSSNNNNFVTQTYNSAISIGYSTLPDSRWARIARIVLKATYEATLLVGVLKTIEYLTDNNKKSERPPPIFLTQVGGGVFRNKEVCIREAIRQGIEKVRSYGVPLDIRIVHFGSTWGSGYDRLAQELTRDEL